MGAGGKIDWDSCEAWQKLVSAIIATGVKLDIRAVATHYGTTYDTLENRLRKIKKDAQVLKDEVASGARGEVAPSRKQTPATPKKFKTTKKSALESVTNGRVIKPSPTKKSPTKSSPSKIKQELFENSAGDIFNDADVSFGDQILSFGSQSFNQSLDLDAPGEYEGFH